LLAAVLSVATVVAQDVPNLAGEWHLEGPAAADLPTRVTIAQTVVPKKLPGDPIIRFYKNLTLERELPSGNVTTLYFDSLVAGTTGGMVRDGAPSNRSLVDSWWEGASLVLTTRDYSGEQREPAVWHEREERWTLLEADRLQVVVRVRGNDAAPIEATSTYTRR
jgi:hypothetical protein